MWNYTPDNTNARGDLWNDEDFSIFSRDQQAVPDDISSGGRALEALVRPYPAKMAGEPLEMSFDAWRKVFRLVFRHDPQVTAPTLIYVPAIQYPAGIRVEVSDGEHTFYETAQEIIYAHSTSRDVHTIVISPFQR